MKEYYLAFFLIIVFAGPLFGKTAPRDRVVGKVVSGRNEPLGGASIYIAGTTTGASTDKEGIFTLYGIPKGEFTLTVSYVGYETLYKNISESYSGDTLILKMSPKTNTLKAIGISNYKAEKNGWEKYDQLFTQNFIGTSGFASNCKILNPQVINFLYSEKQDELHAYADEPLIVENDVLGYTIEVDLVDFTYSFLKQTCVFDISAFYKEMPGDEEAVQRWARNRHKAYYGSMMHFFRAFYNGDFSSDGFEVRKIESLANKEKQRIRSVYQNWYNLHRDSLAAAGNDLRNIERNFEMSFNKDTIKYFKETLLKPDKGEKVLYPQKLIFKDIALVRDNSVYLDFKDYLEITYTRDFEPVEYVINTGQVDANDPKFNPKSLPETYPTTIIHLTQGIPVRVYSNGKSNNVDMYLGKYWAWWEKLATQLPYNYNP